MTAAEPFAVLLGRTRSLPVLARYLVTAAIIAAAFALRHAMDPILPDGYPFLVAFVGILLASALFDHGAGLFAVVLSALLAAWFYIPPFGEAAVEDPRELVALGLFVGVASAMAFVIETLHRALEELRRANAELARSERARALLLHEFRHRTRNDLGSLVGLLHLRARAAPSEAVREGLREAAQHALALARVHTRLAAADVGDPAAVVDTRGFVLGLCSDLHALFSGEGLRPVALVPEAESHSLDTERAVQLGLVLNETATNAMKYAFPEGRAGTIRVRFAREGDSFVLEVADDGIGLPPEGEMDQAPPGRPAAGAGLGTRLLRALAAQLRGSFARHPGPGCAGGTVAELRFPAEAPGIAPAKMIR
jgi:two-component sensor histidine kinase